MRLIEVCLFVRQCQLGWNFDWIEFSSGWKAEVIYAWSGNAFLPGNAYPMAKFDYDHLSVEQRDNLISLAIELLRSSA